METVRIPEKTSAVTWDYDAEADVLYLSVGKPRPAVGEDIGQGVVLRYDRNANELVGLTVIGLRARLTQTLDTPSATESSVVSDKPRRTDR
jgi:uncharacterized protein YuzE